jgi:hypothetical protein
MAQVVEHLPVKEKKKIIWLLVGGNTAGWPQGLMLARQVLYHLSHSFSHFWFGHFFEIRSHSVWASLAYDPPICFPTKLGMTGACHRPATGGVENFFLNCPWISILQISIPKQLALCLANIILFLKLKNYFDKIKFIKKFFQYWDLNSGLWACKAGALPHGPHLQSIFLWLFWRWGSQELFARASDWNPPNLSPPSS